MVTKPPVSKRVPGNTNSSKDVSPWALAGLGAQFFAGILLFLYAGRWLDSRLGTEPYFMLGGVLLGGGGVFWSGYRRLMASQRDSDG